MVFRPSDMPGSPPSHTIFLPIGLLTFGAGWGGGQGRKQLGGGGLHLWQVV